MPKIVDHDKQRFELSETVVKLVLDVGLAHTTLRTVAAEHGCTKGMVQHYFADKDELLLAAVHYLDAQADARLAAAGDGLKGLDELQARMSALLPYQKEVGDEWKARLAFSTCHGASDDLKRAVARFYVNEKDYGMACLKTARTAGQLKSGIVISHSYRQLCTVVRGLAVGSLIDAISIPAASQKQLLKEAFDNIRAKVTS